MKLFEDFSKKQKRNVIIVFALALVIIIAAAVKDYKVVDMKVSGYKRPESYEANKAVDFQIEYKNAEGEEKTIDYAGTLKKRMPTDEEAETYLNEAMEYFEKNLFRKGESAQNVKTGINIPKSLPENPCKFSFDTGIIDALTKSGNINTKVIKGKTEMLLTIRVTCGDKGSLEKIINLVLIPDAASLALNLDDDVTAAVDDVLSKNASEGAVELPKNINGYDVRYVKKGERVLPHVVLLCVIIVISVVFLYKSQNDKVKDKRKEALIDSYADFTGRFVILLGAGLSLKAIWKKLSGEGKYPNELGTEIETTVRQMENGVAEYEAYENFGRRCGVENYIRFASILTQNLRMGSGKMLDRLTAESEKAMQERKNRACLNGNKADAKMMVPMILQFTLVLVIIMVPAMMMVGM